MLKTLWQALIMTIKGERPIRRYGKLTDWIEGAGYLSDAILQEAKKQQIDLSLHRVKVDGRTQSLDTIIKAVNYHTRTEFDYLLKNPTEHTITAIYATNLNDSYAVQRILEIDNISEQLGADLYQIIKDLARHLEAIPPSNMLASTTLEG
jgi:hypothetical protein